MKAIDGDSHFMEPMDLFERYVDPAFRERTVKMVRDPESGKATMLADGKPLKLRDVDQIMGLLVAYGEKEQGLNIGNFDRYLGYSQQWQDMDARVRFLDEEGFAKQVLYPSLGIAWEGEVDDPALADALCRAYNTWAFELVASHKDRLFPAAHISIRDPALAVREMERVAKLGAHTIFISSAPVRGHSFGHPEFDPIWAAAESLDLAVGIHLVSHRNYTGSAWYKDPKPGLMYFTMSIIQDPRMALTTMVIAGDDRFFIGSDYPHAEGFVRPVEKVRKQLASLPRASVDKILETNARNFYHI